MPNELKKITALPDGTPADNDVVPFVDLATNTTKKALKSELKGDKGNAATVDAGTTTTLAAGQSAAVTNVGTTSAAIFNFAIPQGIQGITGADGACVESVAFVGNDMVFTLDDASTITLTNAKTDLKGDTGAKIISGAFVGDDLVFTLDDNSTATVTGAKTDLQGIQGIQGIQGETGNGISNISLISTVGLVKTYRITYTDDTTFDYTVTDGANGTGTLSSVVAGTNISIDNTDVNNPVINNTQDISGKEDVSNKKTSLADNSDTFYPTQKAVKTAVDAKQDTLAFTPEDSANKETSALDTSTTKYPCNNVVKSAVDGKMANVVEDTTPQLGGQLDVNGQALGDGTLEILKFSETASAVNEITVKNAATGNAPEIQATGDDTNIDLNLVPKGTGGVKVGGVEIPSISSTSTLTNKRITQRVSATTSVASITPDISSYDVYELTAQNDNFTLNLPSVDEAGQTIVVRILTSSAKTLTINAGYKAENTLPTALASGKRYEFIINQFNTGGSKEYWITGIEF